MSTEMYTLARKTQKMGAGGNPKGTLLRYANFASILGCDEELFWQFHGYFEHQNVHFQRGEKFKNSVSHGSVPENPLEIRDFQLFLRAINSNDTL